jgi:hypothetical protein
MKRLAYVGKVKLVKVIPSLAMDFKKKFIILQEPYSILLETQHTAGLLHN